MLSKSQVKYIQSLIEKKFRNAEGVFVAEGPKIINELLGSENAGLVALYATEDWKPAAFDKTGLTVVTDFELKKISFQATPNQVLGIFKQCAREAVPAFNNRLSIMLDGIQDPGNFGTIVRIADWFGIRYIVASPDSADVYNPKVVQSSMGSIARVQVFYQQLENVFRDHAELPVFAATLHGKPLYGYGKINEGMLLIGNESRGVHPSLVAAAANQISIPSYGKAESLNAAVATGIILSHVV